MKRIFFILIILPILTCECGLERKENVKVAKFEFMESYNQIHVLRDGKHITSYLYDSAVLKPILYPLYSPSGIRIQRQYPLKIVEGESHDHPHHAGVFFTYGTEGEVNGNNFWAGQEGLTKIRHAQVTQMETEPGKAMLGTRAEWIGKDGRVVLEEDRLMIFMGDTCTNIIDFTIKLKAVTETVVFRDTKEGMFGIRVADWLSEEHGTGRYLNSSGDTTEANVWGKRAKWVLLEGRHEGREIGLVIMHHPTSVNFPTYWHARGYGLFAANPLGEMVFQQGRGVAQPTPLNFKIPAGDTAVFKFRMIIYEGDIDSDKVEVDFERYIHDQD
jgi:hypothetical protein